MYLNTENEYAFARPYLSAGETMLWWGKPGTGHLIAGQDILMIPFSIVWCAFAIFWEASVVSAGAPLMFSLFGIPFVCVGLYMVFGRFLWTAWIRKRTYYVITNKKIIRARGNRIDMLEGRNMPPVHVTAFRDGSGTIRIGYPHYVRRNGFHNSAYAAVQPFVLDNVPDVARVQQVIAAMER